MPDNVAAALALFITACATALLQYSTSHWGKSDRRVSDEPYEGRERRKQGRWDADPEEE